MDLFQALAREWPIVAGAPISVISLMVLAAGAGFLVARFSYGSVAAIAKERLAQLQEAKNLQVEIEALRRLSSEADLAELRQWIDALPRIHVGPTPPDGTPKLGDFWIPTE